MDTQFDQLAEAYEQSVDELPFRRHIEKPSVLAALGEITGLRILDLGCGSGLYTRLLARHGARSVIGIDQSTSMIDYARRREAEDTLGVRYLVQDAGSAEVDPAIAGTCDLVLAMYVLPYAPTKPALHQMCATARTALTDTGGRLVAATLNPDFATTPHYYHPYGFELTTQADTNPHDGDPVGLHSQIGEHTLDVTAYYWSRAAHEQALTTAGFTDMTWHQPHCAPNSDPTQFTTYLATPHFLILTATTRTGAERDAT